MPRGAAQGKGGDGFSAHPEQPTRIVSLSPTSTEDLFAVGAGKQVVAVDDQSDYPKSAPQTKLSGYTPNADQTKSNVAVIYQELGK